MDFVNRVDGQALNKRCIESLILAGAFDCFNKTRSQLMSVYTTAINRALDAKKRAMSGQIDMFGSLLGENDGVDELEYPNIAEYAQKQKLQLEKSIAGVYLSGHPLNDYADKIKQFTLNSSMISNVSDDEDMLNEQNEFDDNKVQEVGGFKDGDAVSCGGVLTEISLKMTKTGQRMAILTLEDMLGSINVVVFPKNYEKFKDLLMEENVVAIKGKMSLKDGMLPSVNAENIELLSEDKQSEILNDHIENVEIPQKVLRLCLIYDVSNKALHNEVCQLVNQYIGNSEIYVKDLSTGNKYKLPHKVEIRQSLQYELESLIGKDNVIIA